MEGEGEGGLGVRLVDDEQAALSNAAVETTAVSRRT